MIKQLRAITLLAVGLASLNAHATTYDLGTLGAGDTLVGHTFPAGGSGSISVGDRFNFSLANTSNLSLGTGFWAGFGAASNLSAVLFSTNGGPVLGSQSANGNGGGGFGFSVANASSGDYYLLVNGGLRSSTYFNPGYAQSISVSPVPEPETWAMMLGGLGLVASAARRKKASKEELAPAVAA